MQLNYEDAAPARGAVAAPFAAGHDSAAWPAGTIQAAAINYLRQCNRELATAELLEAIGQAGFTDLAGSLRLAVQTGVLATRRVGRIDFWSAAPEAPDAQPNDDATPERTPARALHRPAIAKASTVPRSPKAHSSRQSTRKAVELPVTNKAVPTTSAEARYGQEVVLGKCGDQDLAVDLAKLMPTKLFIQAASGGGKSWLLRRLLEQSFGRVQQIVVDPEGELVTLADRYDFLVCSPDSTTAPLSHGNGAQIGELLYRSRRSAILNVSEFDLEGIDRKSVV